MHQRRADDRVPGLRPVRQQHEPERHGVQLSVHRHARLRSSAIGAASAWRRTRAGRGAIRSSTVRAMPGTAHHPRTRRDEPLSAHTRARFADPHRWLLVV